MTTKKQTYVRLERLGDGPGFGDDNSDFYLCPWQDHSGHIVAALEQIEAGQDYAVKFTILELTDDELAAYCEEHGIDWEG